MCGKVKMPVGEQTRETFTEMTDEQMQHLHKGMLSKEAQYF